MGSRLMYKNFVIFVMKKLYFAEFSDFIRTGISKFLSFLYYGWTWTEF